MSYKDRKAAREKAEREAHKFARPPPRRAVHVCDEKCEHYRSPLEKELTARVQAALVGVVPRGAKAVVGWEPISFRALTDVRLICDGADHLMAYDCCLKPNHEGQCYCAYKSIHFTPRGTGDA